LSLIAAQVVVYGSWWAWDGGQSLGPRFLVPAIPLAALLVTPVLERARWRPILIALGILGVSVQILCNLANPNDVFYETVNLQSVALPAMTGQLGLSIPATLWTAYTRHVIVSLLLRSLLPHEPFFRAILFAGLVTLVAGFLVLTTRRIPSETANTLSASTA